MTPDDFRIIIADMDAEAERDPEFRLLWHSARLLADLVLLPIRLGQALEDEPEAPPRSGS